MTAARRSSHKTGKQAVPAPLATDPFAGLLRQELCIGAAMMTTMFKGFAAMRDIQAKAARDAAAIHEQTTHKLAHAGPLSDAWALEAELGKFDMEQGAQYWTAIASIAMNSQMKLGECAMQMLGLPLGHPVQSALEVWQTPYLASLD